jgi:hypothetical protein
MKHSLLMLLLLPALLALVGCGPNHEANVRERAQQFVVLLLQEDYEACAEMTDPAFIRQHGINGAKLRFMIIGAFTKVGNITEEKVSFGEITVDSETNSATVNVSIQAGDEWKPIQPLRWVLVEGEWYFAP